MPCPLFYLLALVWLPVGVLASALLRGMGIPPEPQAFLSLLTVAPAGLPLALACRRLHRKGYRVIAWAAMAVLSVATLVAGLLGPPPSSSTLWPSASRLARRPPPPPPRAIAPFKPARVASHAPPGLQRRVGNTRTKQLTFLRSLT